MKHLLLSIILGVAVPSAWAQEYQLPDGKEIYIPRDLRNNDFTQADSKWSYHRMACTPNFVVFWEKGFGPDLSKAPKLDGHDMTVDLANLTEKLERFYTFYRDSLKFVLPGSKSEKYRMMAMLNYSLEGTAYGGDYDETIGALWIAPNRVKDRNLNAIAHEIGHSFQSQIGSDGTGESWGGGGIFEMTSQWMLWQVNPHWIDDEYFHWRGFVDGANLPFLAGENIYHSPYVLEYWSMKHGRTVIGDLFREGRRGEDPAQTYMRKFNLDEEQFARELCDAYSRLTTFDYPRIHEVCKKYAGQLLNDKPLMTYGVNVLPINAKGRKTTIDVQAELPNDGFAYQLVAVDKDAKATYSGVTTRGKLKFTMPQGVEKLYAVIVAYPKDGYHPTAGNHNEHHEEPQRIYKYTLKQ